MLKFPVFFCIFLLATVGINLAKCRVNENIETPSENTEELSERQEHLQGGGSGNNVVNLDDKKDKKPSMMERIGSMLMLVPLMLQILSLPGALASIKMSLLKSLFIGKLALIIMIYNFIISLRPKSEVVFVNHQPKPPEHYDHFYSPYDDDDSSWFG